MEMIIIKNQYFNYCNNIINDTMNSRNKHKNKKKSKRCWIFFKHPFKYEPGYGVRCIRCGRLKHECELN